MTDSLAGLPPLAPPAPPVGLAPGPRAPSSAVPAAAVPPADQAVASRHGAAVATADLGLAVSTPHPKRHVSWWPWAKAAAQPRVAFFGSSTMQGAGASDRSHRTTSLLATYMGWEEVNVGKGGSLLSNAKAGDSKFPPSALQRWQSDVAAQRPDRILVMYGANDMHQQVPMPIFEPAVAELLTDLKTVVAPQDLMVITPQPVLKTAGSRTAYAEALEAGASAAGVKAINPGQVIAPADMPSYAAPDGIHLNDQGHALLASYLAAKLTDAGWAPAAPIAHGGNAVRGELAPMAAGQMLIDDRSPLSAGEVRRIEAAFTGTGTAVVGVVRPDGKGGFDLMYQTKATAVTAGTQAFDVPRWRVLDGDRLAVWADGAIVGGDHVLGRHGAIRVDTDATKPLRDVAWREKHHERTRIAIRAVDGPGAPLP